MRYRFGPFELDTLAFELRCSGAPVPVEPQVFALLALLIENRDRMVSREEVFEKIWERRIVSESALFSRVKSARQALGDSGKQQRYIKTVHGQGMRFVGDVSIVAQSARLAAGDQAPIASEPQQESRPSVAVLPFRRIGACADFATLADAIPHELIAELTRLRWLRVTARGSSFRLRHATPDITEVGRLLGVRYVLGGSVEVSGTRLSVSAQLLDTRDASVVWADHFASRVDDVHRLRADLSARTLAALDLHIPLHEAALARVAVSSDLDAWSSFHLGLQHVYRFNRRDNELAAGLFRQAIQRDPCFARAHAGLSFVHFQSAFLHYTDDAHAQTDEARRHATRGLELDPLDPFVNFVMGRTYWLDGDPEGGLVWLERATACCPNYAQGIYARSMTEALTGRVGDSRRHVDTAMQLSPIDPLLYAMMATRALTHMVRGELDVAAEWAVRAARSPGAHVMIGMICAGAQELVGDRNAALQWAGSVRARDPAMGLAGFFRSVPLQPERARSELAGALQRLGF